MERSVPAEQDSKTKLRATQSQCLLVVSDSRGRLQCLVIDRDLADAALVEQKNRIKCEQTRQKAGGEYGADAN